jgi:hypothetical protein
LFVTFQKNGLARFDVFYFEKDAETGWWEQASLLEWNIDDEDLRKSISEWEARTSDGAKTEFEQVRDALT